MQYFTRGLLTGIIYAGLMFYGMVLSGCSTSEDADVITTNNTPVAVDDASTVDHGGSARIDLAANDSDADDGLDLASITIVSGPANGSTVVNADGSVDYTHDASNTTADTFTYTIMDNSAVVSNTATVTITVNAPVNIPPTAADDAFTVNKGSTTTLNLAANDSDADDGLDFASISIVVMPTNGIVTANADGTVDYTHDNSNTAADTFSYTIKDNSAALSNVATVTITVSAAPVNVPPTALNDAYTVDKGSTSKLDLAANDSDTDDGLDPASISIVTAPAHGLVTVNADGSVNYTHNGDAATADTFSYTIKDNSGAVSNVATVSLTIKQPPVAADDAFTVIKGSTTTLDLAANDNDADDGLDPASIAIVAAPAHGLVTVNAGGSVNYTHNGDAATADTFSYTIKDSSGAVSNVATVSLTIKQPPVAADDAFTVIKGSAMTLDLAANDSDLDDGLDLASISIVTPPVNGSVKVNADGTVDYRHDNSDTDADTFSYTIKDNSAAVSNTATVTITVQPAVATVSAGIYDATVVEGADHLEFVVSLAEASSTTVSIDYATVDGSAIAGTDYTAASGSVNFAPGEVRQFINVTVLNNPVSSTVTGRHMQLELSNPQNAVLSVDTATGTIVDRDAMSIDAAYDPTWGATGAFTNAAKCGESCHKSDGATMDHLGEDVSPGTQWQHSVMAQAFNDPYWQAAVDDEVGSFPHLTGLIEDTCTTCHAPMGRTHAHQTNTNLDADGFYRFDTAKGEDHSREGVGCTLCHQIADDNLGSEDSFSGQFTVADASDTANYKRIYGPYENPAGNNMNMQTGHKPTHGAHVTDSALCATCHTLYTPAIDPDTGMPSGTNFLEQGPYLEWQNSDYATGKPAQADCQDCHMPAPENYATKISLQGPRSMSERSPYAQHTLLGGNAHLLEIMSDYRHELGINTSTSVNGFTEQITSTRDFLGGAAQISLSTPTDTGGNLEFDVVVTNRAGHKLPSSYPSRRTWLHVTVKDNSGSVIFESGKPDSRGYISTDEARLKADCMALDKLEGFDSGLCYEPHRDVISDPSQVAIYETVLGDVNGTITHTLLRGAQYLKDNRIPPSGFTESVAATIETQTIPSGVTGDGDFNCGAGTASEGCGADTVHYQVDLAGHTGPYAVEARLLYQATQPSFVDGLHTVGDRVNRFKVMYDAVPPSVELLDMAMTP